ncbi:MAG TPA: hypothetical protein VM695_11885 [Phycisphaerae bacterium]|nr:hypothetical protein [Phycisphaerae bacterium]
MSERRYRVVLGGLAAVVLGGLAAAAGPGAGPDEGKYFAIEVVDEQTGRGVPLIELKTTANVLYYTDSSGLVAFREPGLMGRSVFFHVSGHGYEFPKDGFGYRGKALRATPGGTARLKVRRGNVAERLYRITGPGIYRDTVLLGRRAPIRQPLLNGRVIGQDSTLAAIYRGKIHWFWGDTARESYPLGHFATAGATSELPGEGGLDPNVGVDLTYFVDAEGFSRKMVPLPGPGMIWIDAVMTLPDPNGRERLIAHYARMKSLGERTEHGMIAFNDETRTFERLSTFPADCRLEPAAHPVRVTVDGQAQVYFNPMAYPLVRVKADWRHVMDPKRYEAFTPLAPGATYEKAGTKLDRDPAGRLRWAWKADTAAIDAFQQDALIRAGRIKPEEAWLDLRDVETGKPVHAHRGSVRWNEFRKRWVMICVQSGGTSFLGEVWYAEAAAPEGPWRKARKIVTHDAYSFYNPVQHAFLDRRGGRVIYFEGTYASTFSGAKFPTPRYDYNQIMYRLDLADPRLAAAQGR